ncbi:DUF1620 super [Clydaea vesicula]|uniref:ER membrane protein complex subunit 1 n=1 Tax=Clydaea vesicula TaxID=447962 RepID=A0AAD5U1K3_9FUNG|nr:DUF1620 super [Clydaea vesicula]
MRLIYFNSYLIYFILLNLSVGLFEDQTGLADWHKTLIGTAKFINYDRSNKKTKLIVSTNKNVIASLNHKDGSILWRQHLDEQDIILKTATTDDDMKLYPNGEVLSLVNNQVQRYGKSGNIIWTWTNKSVSIHHIFGSSKKLVVLGTSQAEDYELKYFTLNPVMGTPIADERLLDTFKYDPSETKLLDVQNEKELWIVWSNVNLIFAKNVDGNAEKVVLKASLEEVTIRKLSASHFSLTTKGSIQLFDLRNGEIVTELEFSINENDKVNHALTAIKDKYYFAKIITSEQNAQIEVFEVGSKNPLYNIQVTNPFEGGNALEIAQLVLFNTESTGLRLVMSGNDGLIKMYKGEAILWIREEYLTEIATAEFIELPKAGLFSEEHDELNESVEETEKISPLTRYFRRWSSQLLKLQAYLKAGNLLFKSEETSETNNFFRDAFGFKKLIVFATKRGMIVAIDTLSGDVAWRRYVGASTMEVKQLSLVRSSVIKFPPVILIVAENTKETVLRRLNAITGADYTFGDIPSSVKLPFLATQVFKLPIEESSDRTHIFAILSPDLKVMSSFYFILLNANVQVYLFPDTPESFSAVEEKLSFLNFYLTEGPGSKSIAGYSLIKDGNFASVKNWEYLTEESEVIAALATIGDNKVSSLGRVLGDRSVYYKYLSPNFLSFVTLKTSESSKLILSINVVDTVTGSLLYSGAVDGAGLLDLDTDIANFGGASSSVYITQFENRVVATYFNHGPEFADVEDETVVPPQNQNLGKEKVTEEKPRRKSKNVKQRKVKGGAELPTSEAASENLVTPNTKQMELLVLEIFEDFKPNVRLTNETFSSHERGNPHVLAQTFSFSHGVSSIGVTQTHNSITTREIIFALGSDQIYCLNKRILDPRRPLVPSNFDKEEMLIPYKAHIDFNPKEVASYNLAVIGVEKIISSPSALESTSLICSYGLDIFFTRRTPSQAFDVLSEDFNRGGLILTIVLLLIAIQVSKKKVDHKTLVEAWK